MNNCLTKKAGWNVRRVGRSPFKTLKAARKAEKSKTPIGFTATSSLKAMGRMKRSNGCYRLGPKYKGGV
jgi:hypothetical protein